MSPLGRYSIYCDHGLHVGSECVRCWQRRALDAEAALTACAASRDAALQDLSDNAVWHHAIMGERCPPSDDERHCTCVPVLRQRIETLTAERDAGAKLLARQTDLAREAETRVLSVTRERAALQDKLEATEADVRALEIAATDVLSNYTPEHMDFMSDSECGSRLRDALARPSVRKIVEGACLPTKK